MADLEEICNLGGHSVVDALTFPAVWLTAALAHAIACIRLSIACVAWEACTCKAIACIRLSLAVQLAHALQLADKRAGRCRWMCVRKKQKMCCSTYTLMRGCFFYKGVCQTGLKSAQSTTIVNILCVFGTPTERKNKTKHKYITTSVYEVFVCFL